MKITILQGAFLPIPPQLGGAVEKMWFALGKEFANRGHEVTHISRKYNQSSSLEVIDGVLHKRIKGFATPSSGIKMKLLDLIYTIIAKSIIPHNSDIIITNTFWAPIILNKKFQKRCFVDVQRIPKGQMRLYKKVARLRANSRFVAQAIEREISLAEKRKVVMIPNPLPFDAQKNIDVDEKKKVLLYTGRVHPEKGLELLINACKDLRSDWILKIVGPYHTAAGGGGEAYLASLKKLGEGLNIEFTGPIYSIEGLNKYYTEAAIFVYPSIAEQGETFGLAPLEAMAWGCVPIVSGLSCFQDFIVEGTNGLIFNHRSSNAVELLEEAITKLISDVDLRSALANKALEVRKSHSIPLIADAFLKEFEKISSETGFK